MKSVGERDEEEKRIQVKVNETDRPLKGDVPNPNTTASEKSVFCTL